MSAKRVGLFCAAAALMCVGATPAQTPLARAWERLRPLRVLSLALGALKCGHRALMSVWPWCYRRCTSRVGCNVGVGRSERQALRGPRLPFRDVASFTALALTRQGPHLNIHALACRVGVDRRRRRGHL